MAKLLRYITVLIFVALMAAALNISAAASDFHVKPKLPDNQRQNGSTFFDLLVSPGQQQELIIEISNLSENDIVVLVEVLTASTSRNGLISYASKGEMDESLKFYFEDIASLSQNQFELPAGVSIEVAINLRIPNEVFEGAILGSIRVLREVHQEEPDDDEGSINRYASVTAVRLVHSDNAEDIQPEFLLGEIKAVSINYKASIIVPIRNTQPRIIQGAGAAARIYPKGSSDFILEQKFDNISFAPNSIFPLSFIDEEGYELNAGDYTAVVGVTFGNQSWNFEQDFIITEQATIEVIENAPNPNGSVFSLPEQGLSTWMWFAIAGGAAIIITVVGLIILLTRRRRAFPRF